MLASPQSLDLSTPLQWSWLDNANEWTLKQEWTFNTTQNWTRFIRLGCTYIYIPSFF